MLFKNDSSPSEFGPFDSIFGFSGRSEFTLTNGVISAAFKSDEGSYVINFDLPSVKLGIGVHATIQLQNWNSVRYLAIGYNSSSGFRHIKINNIRQDAWVDVGFTHQDIIWLLQNGIENEPLHEINNIRLFIKGEPAKTGISLMVRKLSVSVDSHDYNLIPDKGSKPAVVDVLYEHVNHAFRDFEANALTYLESGNYPMPGGRLLNWQPGETQPQGLHDVNTFRATWHAQHLPMNLLQYANKTRHIGSIFAAKSLIENWLQFSFYNSDSDIKYAWYDHGTAERQLAFILMWFKAIELQMEMRFISRLGKAIVQQAQLLDSEAFYSYHQPQRYHNHAWFQDVALLASALAFKHHPLAEKWRDNAINRFEDQLDTLIVRDGGFAIFVENSIGYHHGVQRLAELMGNLAALSGCATEIPTISRELVAWSDFLRYPDGRSPTQGDTFRLPPRTGKEVRRGKPWPKPSCTLLPKAGYAVVKGNHENRPWMLCLFNTSLSSTHKHEDNCSITFWFDGVEWLIDPSFYSHEYSRDVPKYLRSAEAHNCTSVLGKRYSLAPGKTKLEGSVKGNSFYIRASHTSYQEVEVVREISGCLHMADLEIHDALLGEKLTSITSFIVSENVKVTGSKQTAELVSEDSDFRIKVSTSNSDDFVRQKSEIGVGFMATAQTDKLIFTGGGTVTLKIDQNLPLPMAVDKKNLVNGKRIAIIGSCVTRDIMQFLSPLEIKYFARTSFISLMSNPLSVDAELNIVGNFEKRMVLADLDKRALKEIQEFQPDVLFLDFIDERFDIVKKEGSYFTNSNYLVQSGVLNLIGAYEILNRKDCHGLWRDGCCNMVDFLSKLGCPVVLHKAWWAHKYMDHDTNNVQYFSPQELKLAEANNLYLKEYYDFLCEKMPQILTLEAEESLLYSDHAHKWGRDFFHYSERYYKSLADMIG